MLRIIATAILFTAAALADNVTIGGNTGVTVQGNTCGIASSQTSVSNACGSAQLSYSITPGPIFDSFSASGSTTTVDFSGPGAGDNLASSGINISDTETLEVTGGTGNGLLSLNFLLLGDGAYGDDQPDGGAFAAINGARCSFSYDIFDGTYMCRQGTQVTETIPFTFGTPLQYTVELEASSSSEGDGGSRFTASSMFESYVVRQGGVIVPGATLIGDAPEPSGVWPCLLLMSGLAIVTMRRKQT